MNGFPWATWKFWKRNRSTLKRRVKLGIDYGVSTSKIVFRNCDPSGEESCKLVLHDGSPLSRHWLLPGTLSYMVMTRQIVLPSAEPSETSRSDDGEMSTKESLNLAVFPSTFSSQEFTSSLPSHLAVPRSWQPSLFAQVRSR